MINLKKRMGVSLPKILESEDGKIGYLIAWLMGVPVSILFIIFLIRGH